MAPAPDHERGGLAAPSLVHFLGYRRLIVTVADASPERVSAFTAWTLAVYVPATPSRSHGRRTGRSSRSVTVAEVPAIGRDRRRADDACATNATRPAVTLCVTATETSSATKSCSSPSAVCGDSWPRLAFRPSSPTWSSAAFHVTSGSTFSSRAYFEGFMIRNRVVPRSRSRAGSRRDASPGRPRRCARSGRVAPARASSVAAPRSAADGDDARLGGDVEPLAATCRRRARPGSRRPACCRPPSSSRGRA